MAEEQKPAVVAPEGTVEPTPAPADVLKSDEVKPAVEPETKTEEPAKTETAAETEAAAAAPVEEKKEEKKPEKVVEPVYSGALGYKAPGLVNSFRFSKKYFWFGEEEPVSTQSLSQYLRGEKPEIAHPTAAWSSQTGKGLLFFVKHADQKATPAGVLNLAEATDVANDGAVAFHFKLHNHKHTFEASTAAERDGWVLAVKNTIEEAKAKREEIINSESYKEQLKKLGPASLAAPTAAKEGSTPKKSTDVAPKPTEPAAGGAEATRGGSSSSSSSGEDKKKAAKKNKSRSVSRGKRASIFGGFLAKKDEKKEKLEEKKEEKKEEKEEKKAEKEEKKEAEAEAKTEEPAAPVAEASTTAPVITTDLPKTEGEETALPATEAATETPRTEEKKPKPTKRGSIFGSFVEKLKSPTTEKKESEVAPAAPVKEAEPAAEAPKVEETAPVVEPTAEAPKTEEVKDTKPAVSTPHKEKELFSFGKFLGGKDKAKSPATETAPKVEAKPEEPASTVEPAVATEPAVVEPAKEEEKKEEAGATSIASPAPAKKEKRGSIFGGKDNKLTGLFRNASKAAKPKKEKETATTPAKVEETTEENKTAEPAVEAPKTEEPAAAPKAEATEPNSIGDVVPDAVTVGQAPKSTPEVSATA